MENIGCCCGIDEAINFIIRTCPEEMLKAQVINRLEYHKNQAEGIKPKYYKADSALHSYYKCGHCGHRVDIINNFCPNCGYSIKWESCRCLTGLPLVDAAERNQKDESSKESV